MDLQSGHLLSFVEGSRMASITLRLNPRLLTNPDADMRYLLPDLLAERSKGVISDDGYDYVGEQPPFMILFLRASDLETGVLCVLDVIENERLLGNDLRPAVVVSVDRDGERQIVYPKDFEGPFLTK